MASLDSVHVSWTRSRVQPSRVVDAAGLPRLRDEAAYAAAWDAVSRNALPDWQRPWAQDTSFSRFWAYELKDGYRTAGVTGHQAWRKQVPLRRVPDAGLTTTLEGVTLTSARYLYPTGTGVVVNAQIDGARDAAKVLELVGRLTGERVISVAGSPPLSMAALLGALLDELDHAVLGGPDPAASSDPRPRTIATVTRSTGWPLTPVAGGDQTHRMLEALCRLSGAPLAGGAVGSLDRSVMETTNRYADTVRATVGDGEAVWSPFLAQSGEQQSHKLECYHGSLTLSAMQTGVFLTTARWASGLSSRQLGSSELEAVKVVLAMLGQLYGKGRDVYVASLVHRQIDDSDLVAEVRRMRIELGLGDLPGSSLPSPAGV